MRCWLTWLGLVVVVSLGCTGLGVTARGSEGAQRLCAWAEEEHEGAPCATYAAGDEVKLGDFSLRFGVPEPVAAVTTLPQVPNLEERGAFDAVGAQGVAVPVEVRNDGPVRQPRDVWLSVYTADGERPYEGYHNTALWRERAGQEPRARGELPPGQWLPTGGVYAVPHASVEGMLVHVFREEVRSIYDEARRRRREVKVVVEQAVVDLAAPAAAP